MPQPPPLLRFIAWPPQDCPQPDVEETTRAAAAHRSQSGRQATGSARAETATFQRIHSHYMFAAALRRKYGAAIFRAVSKEICLRPEPGEELPVRVQERAEHMARTAQTVLSGMDFFTRMQLSPALRPPAFIQTCIELGLRPSAITQAQCDAAQQLLDQSFEDAAARHESPVSMEQGMQWLKQALRHAAGNLAQSSDAGTPLDGTHQAAANEAEHAGDPATDFAKEDPIRHIMRKRG